jgi:hypothetical protein
MRRMQHGKDYVFYADAFPLHSNTTAMIRFNLRVARPLDHYLWEIPRGTGNVDVYVSWKQRKTSQSDAPRPEVSEKATDPMDGLL